MKSLLMFIVLVLAFGIFGCSSGSQQASTGPVKPTNETKTCAATETYTEQEPYSDQECNQNPYQDQECQMENLTYKEGTLSSLIEYTDPYYNDKPELAAELADGCFVQARTYITNMDTSESGTFTVTFLFEISNGSKFEIPVSNIIYPGTSQRFDSTPGVYPTFKYQCGKLVGITTRITAPIKKVCESVTKSRQECNTITKYRAVNKTRQVEVPC